MDRRQAHSSGFAKGHSRAARTNRLPHSASSRIHATPLHHSASSQVECLCVAYIRVRCISLSRNFATKRPENVCDNPTTEVLLCPEYRTIVEPPAHGSSSPRPSVVRTIADEGKAKPGNRYACKISASRPMRVMSTALLFPTCAWKTLPRRGGHRAHRPASLSGRQRSYMVIATMPVFAPLGACYSVSSPLT